MNNQTHFKHAFVAPTQPPMQRGLATDLSIIDENVETEEKTLQDLNRLSDCTCDSKDIKNNYVNPSCCTRRFT
jgi:hypothetical protein